ncbi:MarR family transcriptional regulator [Rheinheimera sp. SA_1]|uniref:BlaI/MecI/CopY family transcriptional regulator n=1 Tax=Rheinheimera sp. SA_1 TaxID=1827365 RepID=UPI0007FFABE3|nr:BlaI/MecI/CopY family transcriptional regulator [Rheinheimera sp. SA_1]OBP16340.1 MarR family transcriptional regulator [Rheinheimera sp. SA_1]
MARQKSTELTPAEQRIMQVLWQQGSLTVREITAQLCLQQAVAYTTVQTLCRILHDKGHVSIEKQGKAFVYQAQTVQQEARSQALLSLLKKFFGGSPDLLAQHLIREQALSAETANQLQAKIDEAAAQQMQDAENERIVGGQEK